MSANMYMYMYNSSIFAYTCYECILMYTYMHATTFMYTCIYEMCMLPLVTYTIKYYQWMYLHVDPHVSPPTAHW